MLSAARRLPRARFAGGLDSSLDGVSVHAAAVFGAARQESDLIAAQAAAGERGRNVPRVERTGHLLEILLEHKLALRALPLALDAGGNDPQISRAVGVAAELGGLVRLP